MSGFVVPNKNPERAESIERPGSTEQAYPALEREIRG